MFFYLFKDWGNAVLGSASFLIPLGVVVSVIGTTNGTLFAAGRYKTIKLSHVILAIDFAIRTLIERVSHVVGREGQSPDFLSYIHIEKKTPVAPTLLTVNLDNTI